MEDLYAKQQESFPLSSTLVVRVKRPRDADPASDVICIVDDQQVQVSKKKHKRGEGLTEAFAFLNATHDDVNLTKVNETDTTKRAPRLLLTRIGTVETTANQTTNEIDGLTASALEKKTGIFECAKKKRGREDCGDSSFSAPLLIKSNMKEFQNNSEQFIFVDMFQSGGVGSDAEISKSKNHLQLDSGAARKEEPVRILDPPTRLLASSIDIALKYGDFTSMSQAIIAGGNVGYRKPDEEGGTTALIAAAKHCNLRMVKKILSKNVDALVKDARGKTAMDYAREASVPVHMTETKIDVQQWIYRAASRQVEHSSGVETEGDREKESVAPSSVDECGFVFDIYCVVPKLEQQSVGNISFTSNDTSASIEFDQGDDENVPIVQLDGLHIKDDGQVELVFEYDSDWSDLADDEDVSSNDERYYGNDYPEDEEDSDFEHRGGGGNAYDDDYGDDDDDFKLPRFQQKGVSRVMKVGFLPSSGMGAGGLESTIFQTRRDTEALQELWGEEGEAAATGEEDEHRDRLHYMRGGTGMEFGATPREFDVHGLPKYGAELSDDEDDYQVLKDVNMSPAELMIIQRKVASLKGQEGSGRFQVGASRLMSSGRESMPPRNTIAFDPTLDLEEEQ